MSQNLEDFEVKEGSVLASSSQLYLVYKFIGRGSFGRVAQTVDLCKMKPVAMKILKAKKSSAARREIEMLRAVQVLDPVKTNLVQCLDMFECAGLTCLAFEMLDWSLLQLLTEGGPLLISEIRPITQQLLTAFKALKTIGVIHCDLKPDNIMLVNHQDQPFRVKLIDFGLAMRSSEVRDGMTIQIKAFRAPEVFLGLPLSEAVDMWSLGCLLCFLYTSSRLFGGSCKYEVMKNIVEIIGQPSDHLLDAGIHTRDYFKEDQHFDSPRWWLKTPTEYFQDSGSRPQLSPRIVNSLRDLLLATPEMEGCVPIADRRAFVGLLMGLLHPDPQMRISPEEALEHPFVSMVHLEEQRSSGYGFDSFKKMRHFMREEEPESTPTAETVNNNVSVGPEAAAGDSDHGAPAEQELRSDPACPPDFPPNCPPNCLPDFPPNSLPDFPPNCPPDFPPNSLPDFPPNCPPGCPPNCLPDFPPNSLPDFPPNCPPGFPPNCLPNCLPNCPPDCPPNCPPNCLPDCPPNCPPNCLPNCPPNCQPDCPQNCPPDCPPNCPPNCLPDCPPYCPPNCLPNCPPNCQPDCPPNCPPDCPPNCLPNCLPNGLPNCQPDCPPNCPPDCPPNCLPNCLPNCPPNCQPDCPPNCPPDCPPNCPPNCLPNCLPDSLADDPLDVSPKELAPKTDRRSRWRRFKRFCTKAVRRAFGLRKSSE